MSQARTRRQDGITKRRGRALVPGAESLETRQMLTVGGVIPPEVFAVHVGRESLLPSPDLSRVIPTLGDHLVSTTIDWGDGAPVATFSGQDYAYYSRHTYASPGTFMASWTFTVRNDFAPGRVSTFSSPIEVVPQIVYAVGQGPIYVQAGVSTGKATPVGLVTDIPDAATALHATIDWGDGTAPADASIVKNPTYAVGGSYGLHFYVSYNGAAGFDVRSDHVFARPGTYMAHVSLVGAGVSTTVDVPVVVAEGPIAIVTNDPIDAPTGFPTSFPAWVVHDLANTIGYLEPPTFKFSVDWGDGSPIDTNLVTSIGYTFARETDRALVVVNGGHTYRKPGVYRATLQATTQDGYTTSAAAIIRVKPEVITLTGNDATTVVNVSQDHILVNGNVTIVWNPLYPISASIDWGDGTTSAVYDVGGVTRTSDDSGTFRVFANHAYTKPGLYQVKTSVFTPGGMASETISTRTVLPFEATPQDIAGVAGQKIGGDLATVGLPDRNASDGDYAASVDWGDGSPPEWAAIGLKAVDRDPWLGIRGPRAVATIIATHTYARAGTYHPTLTILGPGGTSRTITITSTITPKADPVPVPVPVPVPTQTVLVSRFGHPESTMRLKVAKGAKVTLPHRRPIRAEGSGRPRPR